MQSPQKIDPALKQWLHALEEQAASIAPNVEEGVHYERIVSSPITTPSANTTSRSAQSPSNTTSTIKRITTQWEGLATEHKVSMGLSCLLAGMMAISSVTQLTKAVQTDEQGHRHVNASHLLMGGVSALLTAGMLYLTHAQFKGAVAAR